MHLTAKQLGERWHMAGGTLQNWRTKGFGPKFIKWGKTVLYPITEIEAWEKKHTHANTAAAELVL